MALVYQNASFSPGLIGKVIGEYGKPDEIKSFGSGKILTWGGRAKPEGGILSFPGIGTALSVEQIDKSKLTITMAGHRPPQGAR